MKKDSTPSGVQPPIDLSRLAEMHPNLGRDVASVMTLRAALGLARNKHTSGVELQMDIEQEESMRAIAWPTSDFDMAEQHDAKRITEDGAEAIALAVAFETQDWCVHRRLQQGEHADFLLKHQRSGAKIAFEVSGVDRGSIQRRLREKLAQVAENADYEDRCAAVVGFEKPEIAIRSLERTAA